MSRRHVDEALRQLGPDAHILDHAVSDTARSTIERVYVLVVVRDLFRDDKHLCGEIVELCKRCSEQDPHVDKVRSFARAGAEGQTITPAQALSIIKSICADMVRNSELN